MSAEAKRIGDALALQPTGPRQERRGDAYGAAPPVLEFHVVQLRKGPADRLLQPAEHPIVAVVAWVRTVGAVGGVAPGPEQASVDGGPEVVQEHTAVLHAFPALPADTPPLLLAQGLRQQDVGVEWHDPSTKLGNAPAVGVRRQQSSLRLDGAARRTHRHPPV